MTMDETMSELPAAAANSRSPPHLLRIPLEVRAIIYGFLLQDCGKKQIKIRNKPIHHCHTTEQRKVLKTYRRTPYYAHDFPGWNFSRKYFETTYTHDELDTPMSTAFMAVNRQVHAEASYILYGLHSFNFDASIEAAVALLADLTPPSRDLIHSVSIRKQNPLRMCQSEYYEWQRTCRSLAQLPNLKRLRIIVAGGKPPSYSVVGMPLRRLEVSDFRLLRDVQQTSMEWVDSLKNFTNLEVLEIQADVVHMPKPDNSAAMQFAMFSMSIETTFADFLKEEYGLPVEIIPAAAPAKPIACTCQRIVQIPQGPAAAKAE